MLTGTTPVAPLLDAQRPTRPLTFTLCVPPTRRSSLRPSCLQAHLVPLLHQSSVPLLHGEGTERALEGTRGRGRLPCSRVTDD